MDCWKEKGSCHIHSPKQQPKCFPLFLANLSFQIYNQTFKIIKKIYIFHTFRIGNYNEFHEEL